MLTIMLGWLFVVGKGILLPILVAVISVYVLEGGVQSLTQIPDLKAFPNRLSRIVALAILVLAILVFAGGAARTATEIANNLPVYEENFRNILDSMFEILEIEESPDWERIYDTTLGAIDDPNSVVDPQCRVIGVDGLRVIDTSIFPRIPYGNLNGPAIMTAEKASDHILNKTPLPRSNLQVWQNPRWKTSDR